MFCYIFSFLSVKPVYGTEAQAFENLLVVRLSMR